MTYRIRAHHGMCFSFFQGKGYSGDFTGNMWEIKKKLAQNPEIVLLCGIDDVCAHCPNNQDGICVSLEKVENYDKQVLALCGICENARMRWHDFEALVREHIIGSGRREHICGDCEWNELCQTQEGTISYGK